MERKLLILLSILTFGFILASCDTKTQNPEVETFTVTFDSNGGSPVEEKTFEKGKLIIEPNEPLRDGYEFIAWFIDSELNERWIFEQDRISEDITLYAKWREIEVITFTVKFDYGYQGSPTALTATVEEGDKVEKPNDPIRDNYNFLGWFRESNDELFDFDSGVTSDLELYAKWQEIPEVIIEHIVTLDFGFDDLTDSVRVIEGQYLSVETPNRYGYIFAGWTLDGGEFNSKNTPITSDITLIATWIEDIGLEGTRITTPQQLLDLFQTGGNGKYWLANDIDMDGISFLGTKVEFSGVLDGNNKRILNYHVVTTGNKTAAFFGKLMSGAVIKNLTVMTSSIDVNGEGAGFIATYGYGGITLENLTFVNVSVKQGSSSYAGILFADNQNNPTNDEPVVIKNIVIKNNTDHYIDANQFGGALVGYIRSKTIFDIENVYIETDVLSQAAGAAAIISRINGADDSVLNIKNLVYKGRLVASKETAVIIGQANTNMTVNLENIFITNTEVISSSGSATETDLLLARRATIQLTSNNVFYTNSVSVIRGSSNESITNEATLLTTVNETWFNASTFDKNFFKFEDDDIIPTIDLGPSVPEGIIIGRDSYSDIFVKDIDEALNLEDLIVSLTYSDGKTEILDQDDYTVDSSSFNGSQTGTYELTVTYGEFTTTFTVTVVEIDELVVYLHNITPQTTQHTVFKVGDVITQNSFGNIVLNGVLTNGERLVLSSGYIFDLSEVGTLPGEYSVKVIYKDYYETSFVVTIVENYLTAVENEVTIQVDGLASNSGIVAEGILTVKTVKEAFRILELSNLNQTVIKKVLIKDGTYFEKVTLNIPNVHLIGESQNGTIIDFNMGSGDKTPTLGEWGTQGSSTFTLGSGATGFIASNLTFSNSFDYYGSSVGNKQGVAIVVQADKSIFYKVSFLGLQDTLYAKDGRQWYLDVYVEGIVDYIFGNGGPAFFENSTIHSLQRLGTNADVVITAQKGVAPNGSTLIEYGYVFYNNTFTAQDGMTNKVVLGRPWGKDAAVAYINNQFGSFMSTTGWVDMSGNRPEDARFFEYNNKIGENNFQSTVGVQLTESQANLFSDKDVVFGQFNGGHNFGSTWDYLAQLALIDSELADSLR